MSSYNYRVRYIMYMYMHITACLDITTPIRLYSLTDKYMSVPCWRGVAVLLAAGRRGGDGLVPIGCLARGSSQDTKMTLSLSLSESELWVEGWSRSYLCTV